VEVVKRRDAFERDPVGFARRWIEADEAMRDKIRQAREQLATVEVADAILESAARLCVALGTDGLRGELTLIRAARALAAIEGQGETTEAHLKRIAPAALRHRLRRNPLDDADATARVARAVEEQFVA
jgi:magnesium chelatase subunit I